MKITRFAGLEIAQAAFRAVSLAARGMKVGGTPCLEAKLDQEKAL